MLIFDRIYILQRLGIKMTDKEGLKRLASWLNKWQLSSFYDDYSPDEVDLLPIDDTLFLIPKNGTKPIRLIKSN